MVAFLSTAFEKILDRLESRNEREFLPAALEVVETPASPTGRTIGLIIMLFFTGAVLWAFIGRLDIIASASGRVLPTGDVKMIQPLEAGQVHAIHVHDGQFVHRGELLIELDSTQPTADRDRLQRDLAQADLDVARLHALAAGFLGTGGGFVAPSGATEEGLVEARSAMRAQADQQAAKIASLSQQIAQKEAEIAGARATIEKLRGSLPMMEEKDRINRSLMSRGYGSSLQALDAAQGLSDARHDLEIARRKLDESGAAKGALIRERDGTRSQYQADILTDLRKAEEQQSELRQEVIKAQSKSQATQLRAPTDGVVEGLMVHTLRGVVMPGQRLMTIVPDTQHLMIEAKIANKDVGFVFPGQKVQVKVETFNFTRYGGIEGKVVDVSRDTVDRDPRTDTNDSSTRSATRTSVPNSDSPTYVARIALSKTTIKVDGETRQLRPGMSVTADIRTGSRSIAEYLLSPLRQKAQESMHEQ